MKRKIYIILFILFGLLLAFFVHILVETLYINLLMGDFSKWSFGFSWQDWFLIHKIGAVVLEILGLIFGIYFGKHFVNHFGY